jgi:hypothetical protein
MIVNFRTREISRGKRKLGWIPTLIIIKKKDQNSNMNNTGKKKKKKEMGRRIINGRCLIFHKYY